MRSLLERLRAFLCSKEVFELQEENAFLSDEITILQEQITNLNKQLTDPIHVLNHILPDKPKFFDYTNLPKAEQVTYLRDADALANNQVFHNEINFLMDNYAIQSITRARRMLDVRDYRSQCLALAALRDRIAEIPKPETAPPPASEPFNAI